MIRRLILGPLILALVAGLLYLDYWLQTESGVFTSGGAASRTPVYWGFGSLIVLIALGAQYELYRMCVRRGMPVYQRWGLGAGLITLGSTCVLVFLANDAALEENLLLTGRAAYGRVIVVPPGTDVPTWPAVRDMDDAAFHRLQTSDDPDTTAHRRAVLRSALMGHAVLAVPMLLPIAFLFLLLIWVRSLWSRGDAPEDHARRVNAPVWTMYTYAMIIGPFVCGLFLYSLPFYGARLAIVGLLASRLGDAGAYFFGKFLGRHKLIPHVSPKKTIEGTVGGLATSVGFTFLLVWMFNLWSFFPATSLRWLWIADFGLALGIVAQLADLFSSAFKRWAAVKDSGRLLPEFGGVLDLTDNFVFAAPLIYLFVWIVAHQSIPSAVS